MPALSQSSANGLETASSARIMIVAGEASGDLHGASLARAILQMVPTVDLVGVGGDNMQRAGVELIHHINRLAVMGITEVLGHLGEVRATLDSLTTVARERDVDAVVLIDYPDFNLTLARRLRKHIPDVPIIYYISPQVWAWRRGRVNKIAQLVDRMLVILPFEKELYESVGLEVDFVGHPLLDVIRLDNDRTTYSERHSLSFKDTWIGLLPGSRRAEVKRLLPPMLKAASSLLRHVEQPCFLIPVSPALDITIYESVLASFPNLRQRTYLIEDDYYPTVEHCRAAVVCSGTATLEAALVDTPMVVVYRTSWLTYTLAKSLVRVPHIALVNLIAEQRAVPELVQGEVTGSRIADELRTLLNDQVRRSAVQSALAKVRQRLGGAGASEVAARRVLQAVGCIEPGDPSPAELVR
ncbi:MAG: lipid-A-disaccharide synthase [Acidobacteria bacterium]|nr:lipid-A-disaccharide synthase [Acidobacteriota bacterium]